MASKRQEWNQQIGSWLSGPATLNHSSGHSTAFAENALSGNSVFLDLREFADVLCRVSGVVFSSWF